MGNADPTPGAPANRRERFALWFASVCRIGNPPGPAGAVYSAVGPRSESHLLSAGRVEHMLRSHAERSIDSHRGMWFSVRIRLLLGVSAASALSAVLALLAGSNSFVYGMALGAPTGASSLVLFSVVAEVWGYRRLRRWQSVDGLGMGLAAFGGFGALPAWWFEQRAAASSIWDLSDAGSSVRETLDHLGIEEWIAAQGLPTSAREVFDGLAGEFDGTFDQLVATARALG